MNVLKPTTVVPPETSFVTTALAPIMQFLPIVNHLKPLPHIL